jgi:hypothetical protein
MAKLKKRIHAPEEIKDHILPKGKTLSNQMKDKFGDLLSLKDDLMDVNNPRKQLRTAKKLGQMNKADEFQLEYGDRVKDILSDRIDATVQKAQHDAELLQKAGKGSIQIQQAQSKTILANSQYGKDRSIIALKHHTEKVNQNTNYLVARRTYILKNQIDNALRMEDYRAKLAGEVQRVPLAQIKANEEALKIRMNGYLDKGEAFEKALPYRKKYSLGEQASSAISGVGKVLGLLV